MSRFIEPFPLPPVHGITSDPSEAHLIFPVAMCFSAGGILLFVCRFQGGAERSDDKGIQKQYQHESNGHPKKEKGERYGAAGCRIHGRLFPEFQHDCFLLPVFIIRVLPVKAKEYQKI